jgi:hypothetical protein
MGDLLVCRCVGSPPPQPSHPQGVRRRVPRCFAATLPQPLKGEGVRRAAFVGAPPSGRCSARCTADVRSPRGRGSHRQFPPPSRGRARERGAVADLGEPAWLPPSDGTTKHSTKPTSGQVAGYPQPSVATARVRCSPSPQPSHPQGVRRWVPRCFAATLPQPIKGEGATVSLCLRGSLPFPA